MRYKDIPSMQATVSANVSQGMFIELLNKANMRLYTSVLYPNLEQLIDRFLASHARIPGIVTEQTLGIIPINVIRWDKRQEQLRIEGVIFLNGAVCTMYAPDKVISFFFVDDHTAKSFHYPEVGYKMLGSAIDNTK